MKTTIKTPTAACLAAAFPVLFLVGQARAHAPLLVCGDNGDGTITCEGGLSDGSPVVGLPVRVVDAAGALLFEGKLDKDHTVRFAKPKSPDFTVTFDAGEGHAATLKAGDID